MSFFDTIAQDLELREQVGAETVTLRVRTTEAGDFTDYTVNYAVFEDRVQTVVNGDAVLRSVENHCLLSRHHLNKAGVPSTSPKRQDVVRRSTGSEWAVKEVVADPLGAVEDCEINKLVRSAGK